MEKGKLILIGALCLIMLALVVVPASAMVYYSGGEKIGTNNIVPITNDPPSTGTLNIYTMCLQGAYSNTIIMTPLVPTPGMTEPLITNGLVNPALIQTFFEQVPPSTTLTLGADGQYSDNVAPGIYELELTDGNAGQPEYALVQIVAGGNVMVRFIGHAASGGAAQPTIQVTSAFYGNLNNAIQTKSVTPYFQTVLHGTTLSVTVTSSSGPDWAWLDAIQTVQPSFTDPAPGIEKGIIINYRINGGSLQTFHISNVYTSQPPDYVVSGSTATITL